MITVLVAWINAKYKAEYNMVFIGTLFVDLMIVLVVADLLQ